MISSMGSRTDSGDAGNSFIVEPATYAYLGFWSGRLDLNQRPLAPKASALAMLRHAPFE